MSTRVWTAGVLTAALALGACGKGGGQGGSQGAGPAGKPPAAAAAASGCRAYAAGKDGVIRTFCDGPGTASFTVGTVTGKLVGGACEKMGPISSFNAGVVTLGGPKPAPDYLGLSVSGAGDFKGGILALHYAGGSWGSTEIHGHFDAKGGSFEGPVHGADGSQDAGVIKGSFTC